MLEASDATHRRRPLAGTLHIYDDVTNTGELLATGGGTVVLDGTNRTSGTETVTNYGTDQSGNPATGTVEVDASSTLQLENATISGGTITDNGALTGYGTVAANVSGSGTVTASDGTLMLTENGNTYTGATTIDSGATLAAGIADAFSALSAVTDNGKLDLGTYDQTVEALSGTNTAALVGSFSGTGTSPAVLTVSNGGLFAGVIQDGTGTADNSVTALTLSPAAR